MLEKDIISLFRAKQFKATPQRVAVYKYLVENPKHPDADEIYRYVVESNPSFSKMTVYNSLQALCEKGFIMSVKIDSGRVRYDANIQLHGHFICEKCKKIYDFPVEDIICSGIDDFCVSRKDVYYSGLCPECK
jgi:Fe2+ or Zn2+ uptake regulation protein